MEIHQKKAGPEYHRLKTMVKRSIEHSLRMKNFEARNGSFETSAVVKNRGTKQREQRSLGDCWQWTLVRGKRRPVQLDGPEHFRCGVPTTKTTRPNVPTLCNIQHMLRSRTLIALGRLPCCGEQYLFTSIHKAGQAAQETARDLCES